MGHPIWWLGWWLFGCGCGVGEVVDGGELEHFEFAAAAGGDDDSDIANLLANQCTANGRSGRDEALGDVRLFAGDELVGELFVLGGIEDDDAGAEGDLVTGNVREIDQ
jgi:hypothetical protein